MMSGRAGARRAPAGADTMRTHRLLQHPDPNRPMPQPQDDLNLGQQTLEDLKQLLASTDAAIAERRVEELKVLADGYAKKLAMNGFSIREGMDALRPYLKLRQPR